MSAKGARHSNADYIEESVASALDRARRHTQFALSEGVAAARAFLDVASLSVSGQPAEAHRSLADLAKALDLLAIGLTTEPGELRTGAVQTLVDALESEIERWEEQSRVDGDARSVLRVFLGLREVLWELGLRGSKDDARAHDVHGRSGDDEEKPSKSTATKDRRSNPQEAPKRPRRVQHIKVQD